MGSLRLLLLEEIVVCLTGKRIFMAHSAAQWKEKPSGKNDGEMKKDLSHLSQEKRTLLLEHERQDKPGLHPLLVRTPVR